MKKKSGLATQILIANGIVLVLVVVTSVNSFVGLTDARDDFLEYRSLSRNSNLSSRIQANMLLARLHVKNYILSGEVASIELYGERFNNLTGFLSTAKDTVEDVDRRALVDTIAESIAEYDRAFKEVILLTTQRNDVVKERLDPNGLAMRTSMTDIMRSAFEDGDVDAAFHAGRLQEALLLGRLYTAKFLNSSSPADSQRALQELQSNVTRRAVELKQYLENPARQAMLRTFETAFNAYLQAFQDTSLIVKNRNRIIDEVLDTIGPVVASTSEQVKLSIQARQDSIGPQMQASREKTQEQLIALSVICIILGILSALWLLRIIRKTLGAMGGEPTDMERIATTISQGDLTVPFHHSGNATGVYAAMRDMVEKLRGIVENVTHASNELSKGAIEMSKSNLQLSQRTEAQSEALENTASSMEEITVTIKNNASNAQLASDLASNARDQAEEGGKVVKKAINAMDEINTSSEKIAAIIGVIDDIAFQTNLLALNAAVEAARAGELGRGFAVVASEVRSLAQRSAHAATEIKALISDSVGKVQDGSHLVSESGRTLDEIVDSVKKVSEIITDIATASQQQSIGVEDVERAIREMDDMTQQNAVLVDGAAATSQSVERQATSLNTLVAFFNVDRRVQSDDTQNNSRRWDDELIPIPSPREEAGELANARRRRAAASQQPGDDEPFDDHRQSA